MVYVDNMEAPFGRMIMCHMYADSIFELHIMARNIGINKKWFQDKSGFPHYDICKSKKALAVRLGAKEITARELVTLVRGHKFDKWFKELCHLAKTKYNNFPVNTEEPHAYIGYYKDGYSPDDAITEEASYA